MKTKHLFFIAISFLFAFTACKKDETKTTDPTSSSSIVGTWKNTQIQVTITDSLGHDSTFIEPARSCESDNSVKFNEDHSILVTYGNIKCDSTEAYSENGGVWALLNNNTKLTVTDSSSTETYDVLTLNATTLRLSIFSGSYVYTFTKQ